MKHSYQSMREREKTEIHLPFLDAREKAFREKNEGTCYSISTLYI